MINDHDDTHGIHGDALDWIPAPGQCELCGARLDQPETTSHDEGRIVLAALWQLFEEDKHNGYILLARLMGRMSYAEIGRELGMTKQAVEKRVRQLVKAYPTLMGDLKQNYGRVGPAGKGNLKVAGSARALHVPEAA